VQKLGLLAAGSLIAGACFAQSAPAQMDASNAGYCLYAGEQYSIGAKRGDQVCQADASQVWVVPANGGTATRRVDPPHWESVAKHSQAKAG
jgi:hypothetical protein